MLLYSNETLNTLKNQLKYTSIFFTLEAGTSK